MKNTFGSAVSLTIFGESHGPAVGAVLDGLAAGLAGGRRFPGPADGPPPRPGRRAFHRPHRAG